LVLRILGKHGLLEAWPAWTIGKWVTVKTVCYNQGAGVTVETWDDIGVLIFIICFLECRLKQQISVSE
jgi:hypothetical protein